MATIKYLDVAEVTLQQIREALLAAQPYVECCTEPDKSDLASEALTKIDNALALKFSQ